MDYATLSMAEVVAGLESVARDTQETFGAHTAQQLNWRPDATRWSVAQCFDHLLTTNRQVFQAAESALTGATPPTLWQRLPMLPAVMGRMLVRSQAPETTRRFTTVPKAQPSNSDIAADVIPLFIEQNRDAIARVRSLDAGAARAIMASPFFSFITYSVEDGWRLVFAHDRRHFEQARRVTLSAGFPSR
ncbi:MAG TPA: DinB family protein [Vicinamibacterales bacterium]|jgi:hypothetical protein